MNARVCVGVSVCVCEYVCECVCVHASELLGHNLHCSESVLVSLRQG